MFGILRSLRDIWRPTPERVLRDLWNTDNPAAEEIRSGRRDLGTFFYAGLGYTEDTWPLLITGQFSRDISDGRPNGHYDFRRHRGRMVIDFENRSAWVQAGWSKRRLFAADIRWDIAELQATVLRESSTEWLLQLVTLPGKWRLAVTVSEAPFLIEIIAARINHLWKAGRDANTRLDQLGEWGSSPRGKDRWRNPDQRLVSELRRLGQVSAKAG